MAETTIGDAEPGQRLAFQDPGINIKPFSNRVRVLVEVLSDADELALATAVFRTQGWTIRPPKINEVCVRPAKGRTWLLLEVRFSGFPMLAIKTAVKRVEQVINRFHLAAWVRRAEILRFPSEQRNAYLIKETALPWLAKNRILAKVVHLLGITRTTGLISVETALPESEVRKRLSVVDLGYPFDPAHSSIQPAIAGKSPDGEPVAAEMASFRSRLIGAAGLAAAMLCGYAAAQISSGWIAIPILAGVVALALIAHGLPTNQPLPQRLSMAIGLAFAFVIIGILIEHQYPVHNLIIMPAVTAGIGFAFLVWRGLVLALRDSWLARQVTWILPFSITIFAPLALWLGGMYDAQYLTYGFGIPSNAISVPTFFRLAIASKSLLVGLGFVFFFVAIIGYVRYFHLAEEAGKWLSWLTITLLAAIYFLSSISFGITSVSNAWNNAARQASAGNQPASYFGIQGTLMCVRPVIASIPVYNGPLPSNQPMLSFGTTSNELWIWDPESERSIGVPLNDVIVTPATGSPARCK